MNWSSMRRVSSVTSGSGSPKFTSGDQSMSVVAFHCDVLPFSYSLVRAVRFWS